LSAAGREFTSTGFTILSDRSVSAALFISAVSVVIAFASLVLNFVLNHRSAVRARMPVLVFVDDPDEECWVLRNVGNGPALNVVVAERAGGKWFNPVRVPPFSKESSYPLRWLGRINVSGLGASYADFESRRYTSTLGEDTSRAYEGDRLPTWHDAEILRYWQLPPDPRSARWGERESDFRA
jgi:hypothetical protein